MSLETPLRNLGLSANETKVYLAALELGLDSAQNIAKKAGIMRTTAYSVLENLAIKGLVYKTKKENKNRYAVESPKNLLRRFNRYRTQLEKNLPELQAIHNSHKTKPKIVFYEGKAGIEAIYADTIKEKPKEILEYNSSSMFEALPDFPKDYVAARRQAKIKAKRIAQNNANWKKHASRDKYELSETILIRDENFEIPVEINIYNDKVAFMSYSDKLGIIIESEGVADTMRKIYNLSWKGAKKSNLKNSKD